MSTRTLWFICLVYLIRDQFQESNSIPISFKFSDPDNVHQDWVIRRRRGGGSGEQLTDRSCWCSVCLLCGLVQQDICPNTLSVCVQLLVTSVAEHLQVQAATQTDSSTDVVGTLSFPALMICVRRQLIADPQWCVITSCNRLLSSARTLELCVGPDHNL